MKIKFFFAFLLIQIGLIGQPYPLVKIAESKAHPLGFCEPAISINPVQPNFVAAASILDKLYISQDSGKTWTQTTLKSKFGVYGDPVLLHNQKGQLFYFHLSDPTGKNWHSDEILDRIVVQRSDDQGASFPIDKFVGFNPPKDQDKQWATSNPTNNTLYCTWTQFDKYDSEDTLDKSNILFSKSADNGETWSPPYQINSLSGDCLDDDQTTEGAVPAAGNHNEVFVAWGFDEGIYFNSSKDGGETWHQNEIKIAEQVGGWSMRINGINRCNGMPITLCDHSNGPFRGTVYVCFADKRNGETNSDIFVIASHDNGKTWGKPIRVKDDTTQTEQFLPWMAIDPVTGYLVTVFYDRRNYSDNLTTDVYWAYSKDGGNTWVNEKISKEPFLPQKDVFFGDYNNISIVNGMVRPIWTRLENNKLSIWTALINLK